MQKLMSILLILALATAAHAHLKLPGVISDHMVVQCGEPVRIWGWADAGAKVTVRLAHESGRATADRQGLWTVKLGKLRAGGPHQLVIKTSKGETKTIND